MNNEEIPNSAPSGEAKEHESAIDEESEKMTIKGLTLPAGLLDAPTAEASRLVLQDLDADTTIKTVDELQRDLKHVRVENVVLYHFLQKNDPAALETPLETPKPKDAMSIMSRRSSLTSKLTIKKGSDSSNTTAFISTMFTEKEGPKINLTQRSDLIAREVDDIKAELKAFMKKTHRQKSLLFARLEEMDTRRAELEESIDSFSKLRQSYDQQTMPLEKFVRYLNEWSKKSRLIVDKIRLRYSSLRVQYQKTSAVLAEKLLIGENLQEIDFEQLRIENLHLVEKIEKKTLLLLELKSMTGMGNLKLSQHKTVLQQKMDEKEELEAAIKRIEKETLKSDDEIFKLYGELDEVKHDYYKIRDKITSYEAPDVMDYIRTKAELDNLRKDTKIWKRRKNIKDMAMAASLNEMKRIMGRKQPDAAWFQ